MKKITIMMIAITLIIASLGPVSTQAVTKKKNLSVKTVYTTSSNIKGQTKKNAKIKITIGKKTYTGKANAKGEFSIKIKKQKAGKMFYVKSYRKKGKKYKYYAKKKVYTIASKLKLLSFKSTSTYIRGYTRKGYNVVLTINGKTYQGIASKKTGYFKIKTGKIGSNKVTVEITTSKGKPFTSIAKTASDVKSKSQLLKALQGSYQAREEGLVGSTKYTGYWHLDIIKDDFSIFDNEAGNPGVSGTIQEISEKELKVKVNLDETEDIPVEWKMTSGILTLKYEKNKKVLKLTNDKKTLIMDQRK